MLERIVGLDRDLVMQQFLLARDSQLELMSVENLLRTYVAYQPRDPVFKVTSHLGEVGVLPFHAVNAELNQDFGDALLGDSVAKRMIREYLDMFRSKIPFHGLIGPYRHMLSSVLSGIEEKPVMFDVLKALISQIVPEGYTLEAITEDRKTANGLGNDFPVFQSYRKTQI